MKSLWWDLGKSPDSNAIFQHFIKQLFRKIVFIQLGIIFFKDNFFFILGLTSCLSVTCQLHYSALALVFESMDSAILWINHHPRDKYKYLWQPVVLSTGKRFIQWTLLTTVLSSLGVKVKRDWYNLKYCSSLLVKQGPNFNGWASHMLPKPTTVVFSRRLFYEATPY